jgi:hypothetical protein
MNDYEARVAAKRERFQDLADRAKAESEQAYNLAKQRSDMIPFGQPILVGHHSEKSSRAFRQKIWNGMDKSIKLDEKAKYYQRKANTYGKGGISSDDPDALQKLRVKLEGMERNQAAYKAVNKVAKDKKLGNEQKVVKMLDLGLGIREDSARALLVPDFCGRVGFAAYVLSNNSGNMKRVRDRIAQLEALQAAAAVQETKETQIGEILIMENLLVNRLQIIFPGKPSEATRTALKHRGFRWSPSNSAWQRQISNGARYDAQTIIANIGKED